MNTVLYVSQSRALVVTIVDSTWQVLLAFEQTEQGVEALAAWLQAQRRRSVVLLLDVPDEHLQLFELPNLGRWQRRALAKRLSHSCRQGRPLHCPADEITAGDHLLLRHFALGHKFGCSLWYTVLQQAACRLRVICPVALLAEQFMLPGASTGVLLCSTAGEHAIRHSWFNSGQLCFTRVLDKHRDSDHFLQLLADTCQYLHDEFGASVDPTASGNGLVLCVTADLPDFAATKLPVHIKSIYLIGRGGFFQPGKREESEMARIVSDVSGLKLTVTQGRLFDFLSAFKENSRCAAQCRRYRMQWQSQSGGTQPGCDVTLPGRVHAVLTSRSLAGMASLMLILAAVLAGWQAHAVRQQVKILQRELYDRQQQLPATVLAPEAMRDYVLLKRTLPEHLSNPHSTLQNLAAGVSGSDNITLTDIEWAVLDAPGSPSATVSPRPRSVILARNDEPAAGSTIMLRVSGYLNREESSISAAYHAFRQFSDRLASIPGWSLQEAGKLPFDRAGSNQANTVAAGPEAGRFSLLFRSAEQEQP